MVTHQLVAADRGLLRTATLANMNWGEARYTLDDVDGDPEISHYFDGFPGERDFGLVDIDIEVATSRAVAWLVFLPADHPGYGFVDADTPELSITTFDGFRGRGIGTGLLAQLIEEARGRGLSRISLSVEDGNRARHLYERMGFAVVGRSGASDTMLLDLG
ncbi:MAG: GNAT family N-acetyltransferase [Pseudolysinimonas sp.]